MSAPVTLRADADARIGLGHAMRCLALGQALVDAGSTVRLVTASCDAAVRARFEAEGIEVRALPAGTSVDAEVAALVPSAGAWVVLDGYGFDDAYVARVREEGARVLVVDDDAARAPIRCDALLNPNLHATRAPYAAWAAGAWLLGTRFTPMRREFATNQGECTTWSGRSRVLVTMGGSDPPGLTLALLEPLAHALPGWTIDVVVGAANPRRAAIEAAATALPSVNVRADVRTMRDVMIGATLAVSASGSTAWELAASGVPMALASLAPNQVPVAEALSARGAALNLGVHEGPFAPAEIDALVASITSLATDAPRRGALAARARDVVDGRGAARIAAFLSGAPLDTFDAP